MIVAAAFNVSNTVVKWKEMQLLLLSLLRAGNYGIVGT